MKGTTTIDVDEFLQLIKDRDDARRSSQHKADVHDYNESLIKEAVGHLFESLDGPQSTLSSTNVTARIFDAIKALAVACPSIRMHPVFISFKNHLQ